jgi:hypothetical protein
MVSLCRLLTFLVPASPRSSGPARLARVAAKYLDYWERLAKNLTPNRWRAPNKAATPTFPGKPLKKSINPLFSARDKIESNETLQWHAGVPKTLWVGDLP